jgi:transketolase
MLGTRDVYGTVLAELGEKYPEIVVLDADLSGSTRTAKFGAKFPDRFFNLGVQEQNLMSVAAGMALRGKIPFVSTFAIFAAGRAWEQVRQSVCFNNVNVKIVASHGGLTVGADGGTHQALEDIGTMRILPNMRVIVPGDGHEAAAVFRSIVGIPGPFYVRVSREKFPVLYDKTVGFELGKAKVHFRGTDATIIACGYLLHMALEASHMLKEEGLQVGVVNMSSIKPIDREEILRAAQESGAIVTAEEHNVIGGLGGAVAEVVAETHPVPVIRVGMNDRFGKSGDPEELFEEFGITAKAVVEAVHKSISLKQTSPTPR